MKCAAYRFGPFRLRLTDRILERDGVRLQLTPKVIDTLVVLIEHTGQVVTKDEIMKAVWPDVNVVESGLTRNISVLRKAIEEGMEEGSVIETIPRRGYRFLAKVTEEAPPAEPVKEKRTWRWSIAAGVAVAAALGVSATWKGENPKAAVDPRVRIGEHLLYKLAPEETLRALGHFEQAVAANPKSAAAHAGRSLALVVLEQFGVWLPPERTRPIEDAARRAVELDPASSSAHLAMAMAQTFHTWNFAAAKPEFERALQLAPDSVQARLGYSRLKQILGDASGARKLVEEALRLDPASPPLGVEYCRSYYYERDFRRAESECRKVLDREPHYALAHYYLSLAQDALGRPAEAEQSLRASGLRPAVIEADLALFQLRFGHRGPAEKALEGRRELVSRGKVDPSAKLLLAAALGNMEEAYEAIEAGLVRRAPEILTIHLEPRLDALRGDPRYPEMLRRAGIPRT